MRPISLKTVILAMAVAMAGLASCGSDDNDPTGGVANKNANTPNAAQPAEITRLEFPKISTGDGQIVVVHKVAGFGMDGVNYSLEWDSKLKAQRWTCYQMYAGNSASNWKRKDWEKTKWHGDPFQVDPQLPADCRTSDADYKNSGYDRGHICPSADRLYSQDVNEQTFYFSNMHPQSHGFNAGIWDKMEKQVRAWNTASFRDTLFVCKGGTIDASRKQVRAHTKSGIIVPKYFFMAVLCKKDGKYKAIAFWAEHTTKSSAGELIVPHMISVDELEKRTGIDFFCNLPDNVENQVEAVDPSSETVLRSWNIYGK